MPSLPHSSRFYREEWGPRRTRSLGLSVGYRALRYRFSVTLTLIREEIDTSARENEGRAHVREGHHPNEQVRWGPRTWGTRCMGYLEFVDTP